MLAGKNNPTIIIGQGLLDWAWLFFIVFINTKPLSKAYWHQTLVNPLKLSSKLNFTEKTNIKNQQGLGGATQPGEPANEQGRLNDLCTAFILQLWRRPTGFHSSVLLTGFKNSPLLKGPERHLSQHHLQNHWHSFKRNIISLLILWSLPPDMLTLHPTTIPRG